MKAGGRILVFNLLLAALVVSLGVAAHLRRLHRYDALILKVAGEQGVDPRLVAAVVWVESGGDAAQVGGAGEMGLMQVTEAAAAEWAAAHGVPVPGREELMDPELNLRIGTWYLQRALHRWREKSDPVVYALAEYNAGASSVRRWERQAGGTGDFRRMIGYPGTRRYVERVLARYRGRAR